jgi:hypothetical protein
LEEGGLSLVQLHGGEDHVLHLAILGPSARTVDAPGALSKRRAEDDGAGGMMGGVRGVRGVRGVKRLIRIICDTWI